MEFTGLDDLCVRFIINLPQEELLSVERICFQVEEAQWFYEDFIRPLDPDLPSLNLKTFCLRIFQHCPLLSEFSSYHHSTAFSEFLAYKTRVPVRGAIMLNQDMDQVVLVKGWKKGANWSFPRGKINKDEPDLACAVREVYEETGFDINQAGLVGNDEDMKYIEVTMREQHMRLYIFRGVPMETLFEPRTRKEISKIQWYNLSELPTLKKQKQQMEGRGEDLAINANKYYMVAPFMVPLKKWISHQKKLEKLKDDSQLNIAAIVGDGDPVTSAGHALQTDGYDLLAGGRQPSGLVTEVLQSGREASLSHSPEGYKLPLSAEDASAHLKNLLQVPLNPSVEPTIPLIKSTLTAPDPSALLALLQPSGSKDQGHAPQKSLYKGVEPLPTSLPLNSQQGSKSTPKIPTTVEFSTSSMPNQNDKTKSLISDQVSLASRLTSYLPESSTVNGQSFQSDLPLKSSRDVYKPQTLLPQFISPYQRISGLGFAQNSRTFNSNALSGPPANDLPRPKLTSHSSALLDLFKSSHSLNSKAMNMNPVMQPSVSGLQLNLERDRSNGKSKGNESLAPTELKTLSFKAPLSLPSAQLKQTERSSLNSPQANGNKNLQRQEVNATLSNKEAVSEAEAIQISIDDGLVVTSQQALSVPSVLHKLASEHQDTLLNLLRKPSILEGEPLDLPPPAMNNTPTQKLEPPSTLVELSALSSPAHSREPSRVDPNPSTNDLRDVFNGSSTHKGPVATSKSRKSPVSATVNGPLNVPYFEVLAKTVKETNATLPNKHPVTSTRLPVTIISRPTSTQGPLARAKQKKSHPAKKATDTRTQTLTRIHVPTPTTTLPNTPPTVFHPQILRRPHGLHALQDSTVPSPIQSLPSPKINMNSGHRPNPSDEHKQVLLSLFNKPSSLVSPALTNPVDGISPLSEKSPLQRSQTPTVLPIINRSRVESLASVTEEGTGRLGGERRMPRTTKMDRRILLGYLEGVVNGERR